MDSFGRRKVPTELNLFDWAKEVEQRGQGNSVYFHG
jgi:hypothetical protein